MGWLKGIINSLTSIGVEFGETLLEKRKIKFLNVLYIIAIINNNAYLISYSLVDFNLLLPLIISAGLFNIMFFGGLILTKFNQIELSKHIIAIASPGTISVAIFGYIGTSINLHFYYLLFAVMPLVLWDLKQVKQVLFYFILNSALFAYSYSFFDSSNPQLIYPSDYVKFQSLIAIFGTQISIMAALWINLTHVHFNEKQLQEQSENLAASLDEVRHKKKMLRKQADELDELNLELINRNNKLNELNATKDKFFAIIAHDLRNPLGNFRQVTKLLSDSFQEFSEEEKIEFLQLLKESSKEIYDLLENLLLWANSQRGIIRYTPKEVNLSDIATEVSSLLKLSAENKFIKIESKISDDINLFIDTNMIRTIFRNLISNAIKFSPIGSIIEIGIVKDQELYFNNDIPNDMLVVYVKDQGIGMSDNTIEKLFKIEENVIFQGTAGEQGTGLGLIICKEFIEQHGGKIWAESEIDSGSTFYFSLPIMR